MPLLVGHLTSICPLIVSLVFQRRRMSATSSFKNHETWSKKKDAAWQNVISVSYQSGLVQENESHRESERHRDTCTTQLALVWVQRWPSAHEMWTSRRLETLVQVCLTCQVSQFSKCFFLYICPWGSIGENLSLNARLHSLFFHNMWHLTICDHARILKNSHCWQIHNFEFTGPAMAEEVSCRQMVVG